MMQLVKEEKLQVVAGCAPPAGAKDVLLSVRCPVKVKSVEQSRDGEVSNKWVARCCWTHLYAISANTLLSKVKPCFFDCTTLLEKPASRKIKGAGTLLDGDLEYRETASTLVLLQCKTQPTSDFCFALLGVQHPHSLCVQN